MKRFQAGVGATMIVLTTAVATPAGAENVLRWASETEPLTFDPHSANNTPTFNATQQVYETARRLQLQIRDRARARCWVEADQPDDLGVRTAPGSPLPRRHAVHE